MNRDCIFRRFHLENVSKTITLKMYSDSVLMKQTKAWLVDQIRLLEQAHRDDEWQIDNQAKNCEKMLADKEKRIQELETELSHREEDLVHADEKVFYRETAVKLEEDKIKQQAVREFAERLKQALFVNCTIIRRSDDPIEEDMKSEEVNDTIDLLLAEVTGE